MAIGGTRLATRSRSLIITARLGLVVFLGSCRRYKELFLLVLEGKQIRHQEHRLGFDIDKWQENERFVACSAAAAEGYAFVKSTLKNSARKYFWTI